MISMSKLINRIHFFSFCRDMVQKKLENLGQVISFCQLLIGIFFNVLNVSRLN